MRSLPRLAVVASLLLTGAAAQAQETQASPAPKKVQKPPKSSAQPSSRDPFEALIPPDVVMANQNALGLTEAQRRTLREALQQAESRFADLQWRLSAETERLGTLLRQPVIDEREVLEQIDRVLTLERDLKRTKIVALVRVTNTLTPEQRERATALRRSKS